jgi:hypothetical protein
MNEKTSKLLKIIAPGTFGLDIKFSTDMGFAIGTNIRQLHRE